MTTAMAKWVRLFALYIFMSYVVGAMCFLVAWMVVKLPQDPNDAVIVMFGGVLIALGGVLAIGGKALAGTVERDWQVD